MCASIMLPMSLSTGTTTWTQRDGLCNASLHRCIGNPYSPTDTTRQHRLSHTHPVGQPRFPSVLFPLILVLRPPCSLSRKEHAEGFHLAADPPSISFIHRFDSIALIHADYCTLISRDARREKINTEAIDQAQHYLQKKDAKKDAMQCNAAYKCSASQPAHQIDAEKQHNHT